MATISLREEATDLLQRLIRLDTVNPPGNETAAAELLREYLAGNGVESELYARVPERANLVARIPGRGAGARLLLLSHTDGSRSDFIFSNIRVNTGLKASDFEFKVPQGVQVVEGIGQ